MDALTVTLAPLPTADPAGLSLPELARLYEDLCPKAETPYKAAVRAELEGRLRPGREFVDGLAYRFARSPHEGLLKVRIVTLQDGVPVRRKKTNGRVLAMPATGRDRGRRIVS